MTLLYNMFATACCACHPILHHNILLQILCFHSYSAIPVLMLVVYTIHIFNPAPYYMSLKYSKIFLELSIIPIHLVSQRLDI